MIIMYMLSLFSLSWLLGEVAEDDDRDWSWRSVERGAKLSAKGSDSTLVVPAWSMHS